MINFDALQFDQTTLLFFLLSAVGLIRERRVLPFLIVIVGSLFYGPLSAVFLAGLIVWHRVDFQRSRWVQLKDLVSFLLILVGAVAPEPYLQFCAFFGVLGLSLSFGRGALGVIPPLLLLRQFYPHPVPLEVILGSATLYWLVVEIFRWSKLKRQRLFIALTETVCALGILYGLRDFALRCIEIPGLITTAAVLVLIPFVLFIFVKWKAEGFWLFFHRSLKKIASSLSVGGRLLSDENPWARERNGRSMQTVEQSFNRIFALTFITVILLGIFLLVSRGGLS